ncbi:DUF3893 domain-containing protein [Aromatoleum toluvorans]|uniref:DUF3893 domain-containing protein n=1 Tax=Aromatoleum toluvorans TaxID=92002 RepID=A0ABX1PWK8_9RHOO|nr:RNaseH domain-containing protein [Aromatoleum toluvorans]NMG42650.1 DUF3893 domain-containing protein [Aromatoleum toluvorans]
MTAAIHPYLYEIDAGILLDRRIVRYSLPLGIYGAIKEAQGVEVDRNANIAGLSAVLGWAAPSVDLVGIEAESYGEPTSITLIAIDPASSVDEIRREIEVAVAIWLGIVLPDKSSAIIAMLQDGRSLRGKPCKEVTIDPRVTWNGACPVPKDPALFNLITLAAARALEGKAVNEGTCNEGVLVSSGPQRSLYSGKTLLRYEPSRVERKSGPGWWTELFSVAAVSTPESDKLRVSVNVGIRNFGSVHAARLSWTRARSMDVFLPVDPALNTGAGRMRCVDLATTRQDWRNASEGKNGNDSADRRVLKAILGMSGIPFDEAELGMSSIIGDRVGLYPRFGTVHGDQWAPGGTGLPSPERAAYLDNLDRHLGAAGFHRVDMERVTRKGPRTRAVVGIGGTPAELRAALGRSAHSLDKSGESHLVLLKARESGTDLVSQAVCKTIGNPDEVIGNRWHYSEGPSLVIDTIPAGSLAEMVDDIDRTRLAGLAKEKRWKVEKYLLDARDKQARQAMREYLDSQQPVPVGPWMALLEMNKALRERSARDPYLLTYQVISERQGVAQVRLFDPDDDRADVGTDQEDAEEDPDQLAYQNAFLDLLRAYGVCPVERQDVRLAAWWMIDVHGRQEYQAGERGGLATPVYVECHGGTISVCLLGPDESVHRCSYPEAIRRISMREVLNLRTAKKMERTARVGQFFAQATPRDRYPTVLFVEATNIRQSVPGLQNSLNFQFDALRLGAVGGAAPIREISPEDNIAIVRITDEAAKAPCYWVEGNVQGTTAGVFKEPTSERTYWVSRGLPTPLQRSLATVSANKKSRHESGAGQLKHRRFPSLSEVSVMVKGKNDDALGLVLLTRQMMQCHIATDERTILPFPLHEAGLLAGAVR